ncbi:hypothetical protein GGS23DRAFT_609609 [Durotheca rogersii]|uniref:uncharacterized protein n=1 Tax=Durotheca rogersii TaxID=419775 RepID=UPI002220164D|nr:uncharacterized protein GGS23DRAFT_609609 [Durotheca rogersii]KAI5863150.1 hypothetical protein GGS23DRAFT_609609 [Durotheca rogersii]
MALTERDNISIAEIAVYVPALAVAGWLAARHGFGRNAGWLYLIVFAVARVLGAALQLGTLTDPRNASLYVGAATLRNVGLSPLIMVQLALVGRAAAAATTSSGPGPKSAAAPPLVTERHLRLVQLVALAGLILGAVGGAQAPEALGGTGRYEASGLSKAGVGLMAAAYVLLALAAALVAARISRVAPGSRRLVLAVGAALPFLLVRLAYSAEATFGNRPEFNPTLGDPSILLGMGVVMEMVVVAVVEGVGATLTTSYQQPSEQRWADFEMNRS